MNAIPRATHARTIWKEDASEMPLFENVVNLRNSSHYIEENIHSEKKRRGFAMAMARTSFNSETRDTWVDVGLYVTNTGFSGAEKINVWKTPGKLQELVHMFSTLIKKYDI